VFWSILHRTILMELVKVFAISLLGITGILLMAGIVAEATQHGLGPGQILAIIPLIIPSTLPYTLPATTLFATCVVYGRLANDNEIIAIKAAGIHLFKVVWPGVLLGLVMSAVTLGLFIETIPFTHRYMRTMFLNDIEELLYGMLKRDRHINEPRLNYAMWVKEVYGRELQDAVFKRRDGKGRYDIVATARKAELRVNLARREVLVHMRQCNVLSDKGGCVGYFEDREWPVELPPDFGIDRKIRPSDLTWFEVLQRRKEVAQEKEKLIAVLALPTSKQLVSVLPIDLPLHIRNVKAIIEQKDLETAGLNTELQMRPALGLGCLCFVLVGCPVGIWLSKSDYLSAFITCFLPIVFVYYPVLLCGTNFAKSDRINPALALWAANGVVVLVALVLFRRLLKN
jgi:lipopolysaccharide export system permease protein